MDLTMNREDMNTSELEFDPNKTNIEGFIERILPTNSATEDSEVFSVTVETAIDEVIDQLEKILNLQALTDDEWAQLYEEEQELHDDIEMLDFDDGDY